MRKLYQVQKIISIREWKNFKIKIDISDEELQAHCAKTHNIIVKYQHQLLRCL